MLEQAPRKQTYTIQNIVVYAVFTAILFVQEQILSFLPNIQLTVFLIVVYTKVVGGIPTLIITVIHILLDCMLNGGMSPHILIPMCIGWLIIPITLGFLFKTVENPLILALFGILYSICYSMCFTLFNCLFLEMDIKAYIVSDIPFVILLSLSSFVSILLLYEPTTTFLKKYLEKINCQN